MGFAKGHKLAKGGARPGAGRKKSLAKQLEAEFIKDKENEAEFGFALFVREMHNARNSRKFRLYAANMVMDRVWGKPKEKNEQSGELVIRIVRDEGNSDTSAETAPSPEQSQA